MTNNSANTYIIKNKFIASRIEVYKLIIRGDMPMQISTAFSLRILEMCEERKISYYTLSYNATIPMSTLMNTIHRGNPTLKTLCKICYGLGITMVQFFKTELFNLCDEDEESE